MLGALPAWGAPRPVPHAELLRANLSLSYRLEISTYQERYLIAKTPKTPFAVCDRLLKRCLSSQHQRSKK